MGHADRDLGDRRQLAPEILEHLLEDRHDEGDQREQHHVCVDDATRLAYVEVLCDERATTAIAFLRRAVDYYLAHGITVERLMTDNGSAYRSTVHALACKALRIRHIRTRAYRPRTNGKAERFICTMLGSCAYAAIYPPPREPPRSKAGYGATTSSVHMAPSAKGRPELGSPSLNNVVGSYI